MSPLLHVEAIGKNFGDQKADFKVTVIVAENDSPTFKAQGKDYSQKVTFNYQKSFFYTNNIYIFKFTQFTVSQCWIYPNKNEDREKHRSF